MKPDNIILNPRGFTDFYGGYSRTFSWCRTLEPKQYYVYGHLEGWTPVYSKAVVDDFGTLVRVPS